MFTGRFSVQNSVASSSSQKNPLFVQVISIAPRRGTILRLNMLGIESVGSDTSEC